MVILYTTGCPKCEVLKEKLDNKRIKYETITDVKVMRKLGFMQAPMLDVDGEILGFTDAVAWVNGQ